MPFFSTKKSGGVLVKCAGALVKSGGVLVKCGGALVKSGGVLVGGVLVVGAFWPVTLRGSAEQSPCFVPNTNKSRIKRHHTYIVFILQYYIFSSLFYIKKIIKIRIPGHGRHLTINHWRSNRRIINKLILAQCNINRQKKDNYWYYSNKFYLIDNSNNNKCNKRWLFNMKFIKIGKETGKCYKVTFISWFIVAGLDFNVNIEIVNVQMCAIKDRIYATWHVCLGWKHRSGNI